MRILLISHIFPPAIDGGSKVVHKIGEYFESNNHQVIYLSSNCKSTDDFVNPKSEPIISDLKNHIYLPVHKNLRKFFKLLYIITQQDIFAVLQKGPIFKIIPLIKTIKQIRKFNPDVIVAGPLPTTIVIYAHFIKYLIPKTKLIINASFHETDQDFNRKPLIKSLQSADFIWALTQHEKDMFINKYNISSDKIILLGNGVDKNFINPSNTIYSSQNILFIGSFAAHKNIETLIKAFINLNKKYKNSTLTLVGQKTLYFPKIQKLLKKSKSIKTIFNPNNKEIIKLIDNCQFLVQPSLQESFGLTIIEANARRKPVIVSNIPTMSEIVSHTGSGLIFNPFSVDDLRTKMEELINNPNLCQKLGENGYQYVSQNYTWNIIGKKLESAILNYEN